MRPRAQECTEDTQRGLDAEIVFQAKDGRRIVPTASKLVKRNANGIGRSRRNRGDARRRCSADDPGLHRALARLGRTQRRCAVFVAGARRGAARHVPLAVRRRGGAHLRDERRGSPRQAQRQGDSQAQPAIQEARHANDLTSHAMHWARSEARIVTAGHSSGVYTLASRKPLHRGASCADPSSLFRLPSCWSRNSPWRRPQSSGPQRTGLRPWGRSAP